jgi:Flp pilus assembly protein TadG
LRSGAIIARPSKPPRRAVRRGVAECLADYLRRHAKLTGRFCRAEGGATAVEFAIIGPAFIATLIAALQVCIVLFAQLAIQNAAVEAGRYFMTGQAQSGNWSASTIVGMVCPTALFNCTNMYIVVQDYSSFAAANTSPPAMYNGSTPNTQANYSFNNTGAAPTDIVVVQLVYAWPVITGLFGFNISNLPNNQIQLTGVTAIRVEPYL